MTKDFFKLTDVQASRDSSVAEHIRLDFIKPLVAELKEAIPGYMDMSETARFGAIMELNNEHAKKGAALRLDFGYSSDFGYMKSYVFSGGEELYYTIKNGDVLTYEPMIVDTDCGASSIPTAIEYLLEPPEGHEHDFRESVYDVLPLPFKIALIALYLRQNMLITLERSCRFAAGWQDDAVSSRITYRPISDGQQRFGWRVSLRDTTPENELGKQLMRGLRLCNREDTSHFMGWGDPSEDDFIPLFSDDGTQKRDKRESTKALEDFFSRVLPKKGYHVGRSGSGIKITIEDAYKQFDALYPQMYTSKDSFKNAYYNMRKNSERG